jgi:peptidoglycan hydrolase-like protein with peptidoglycan-binding domain
MTRTVQLELYRLGCGSSSADGKWNSATREGLRRFSRAARVKLDLEAPSNAAITALQKQNGRVCPLECGRGMQAHGESCVAIKREPPPRSRKAERPQRRRHEAVETVAAPPPAAAPPIMMGPFGGGYGGGMMFFGMGRRH